MLVIKPDFTRLIELPGVGPCPRPVDIDRSVTGFNDLISLRVYTFAQDLVIGGEAEEDELFIVLLRGAIDIYVTGGSTSSFVLQADGETGAAYLPPHDCYRLHTRSDAAVAYARARPRDGKAKIARAFDRVDGRLAVVGYADSLGIALSAGAGDNDVALSQLGNSANERLIHVRSTDGGAISVAGQQLHDWQTLALGRGDPGEIDSTNGNTTILVIVATRPAVLTNQ